MEWFFIMLTVGVFVVWALAVGEKEVTTVVLGLGTIVLMAIAASIVVGILVMIYLGIGKLFSFIF